MGKAKVGEEEEGKKKKKNVGTSLDHHDDQRLDPTFGEHYIYEYEGDPHGCQRLQKTPPKLTQDTTGDMDHWSVPPR